MTYNPGPPPKAAEYFMLGCFLLIVIVVLLLAFVVEPHRIMVPVFEVVDVKPGRMLDLRELGIT